MRQTFSASVWREDDWYVAQCLGVDIASQGESEEEALENLREAIELHFEPPGPDVAPRVQTVEAEVVMLRPKQGATSSPPSEPTKACKR